MISATLVTGDRELTASGTMFGNEFLLPFGTSFLVLLISLLTLEWAVRKGVKML